MPFFVHTMVIYHISEAPFPSMKCHDIIVSILFLELLTITLCLVHDLNQIQLYNGILIFLKTPPHNFPSGVCHSFWTPPTSSSRGWGRWRHRSDPRNQTTEISQCHTWHLVKFIACLISSTSFQGLFVHSGASFMNDKLVFKLSTKDIIVWLVCCAL